MSCLLHGSTRHVSHTVVPITLIMELKATQKLSKVAQKVTKAVFLKKCHTSKWPQKLPNILAHFLRTYVTNNFQYSPNLVTLPIIGQKCWKFIRAGMCTGGGQIHTLAASMGTLIY